MARNKKTVVFLLVITAVVWGIVFYRILISLDEPETIASSSEGKIASSAVGKEPLSLNYPDPFLGGITRQSIPSKPVAVQPPSFSYRGKIRRKKKDFLILETDGKQWLVKHHTVVDGYKIEKVFADSLVVRREGKRFVLKLE